MSDLASDPSSERANPAALTSAAPLDFSGSFVIAPARDAQDLSAAAASAVSEALCARLTPVSFGDRAMLFASGAQAWKFALETIRRYHRIVGRPKRRRLIICAEPADEAAGAPPGLEGDGEITILRSDNLGALRAEIDATTAGLLIAPVRTNTGLEVVSQALLAGLRESADEYGLILVFDETFCGLGRSGMLWAHEWTGVTPDLMITTQGLAGSLPLAALVMTQRVARGAPDGPPLADLAALHAGHAVLDALLAPDFQERAQNRSWRLEDRLASLLYKRRDSFTGLRGIGLMQGLIRVGEAAPMQAKLAKRGLLTRAMGSVLALFPPLTVEESEIDAAVVAIDMICAEDE